MCKGARREDNMGRDSWSFRATEKEREKRKRMNPIWRPIGCVLVLMLAAGGYLFAGWFLTQNARNDWIPIPSILIEFPLAPGLPEGLVFKLVVAFIFMIISYGVLSVLFAILFPVQPGEYDHPPLSPSRRQKR
jgi:hypothetical protein